MINTPLFWSRVSVGSDSDCWHHRGAPGSHGYSQFAKKLAHRVSYEIHFGEIPSDRFVCHRCNNKRCVNPNHLYLGTHTENMDDVSRGNYHPKRKLTGDAVREIRASTEPARALARRFGVSAKAVQNVLHGVTYRHE